MSINSKTLAALAIVAAAAIIIAIWVVSAPDGSGRATCKKQQVPGGEHVLCVQGYPGIVP